MSACVSSCSFCEIRRISRSALYSSRLWSRLASASRGPPRVISPAIATARFKKGFTEAGGIAVFGGGIRGSSGDLLRHSLRRRLHVRPEQLLEVGLDRLVLLALRPLLDVRQLVDQRLHDPPPQRQRRIG